MGWIKYCKVYEQLLLPSRQSRLRYTEAEREKVKKYLPPICFWMKQSDLEAKQWNNTRFCIFLIILHDQCEVLQVFVFGSKWSIAALKSKGEVYECITRITGSLTRKLEQRKPSKAPCKPNFGSDVSLICIITIILIIVIVIIILEDLNFFLFVPLEGRRPSAAPNTCTAAKAIHPNSLHTCKYFYLVSLCVFYFYSYLRCNAEKKRSKDLQTLIHPNALCLILHFHPIITIITAQYLCYSSLYWQPSARINTLHWSILPNNIFRIEIFSVHLHCVTWSLRKASHICASHMQLSCMNAWEFKNAPIGRACNGAPANEQARVCKSSGMTGQWMKSYPSANIAFQAKLIPSDG